MADVTEDRKLENGLVIPGTFKAITKNPAIACKVSPRTYEHEALMNSHGYFLRGNAKKIGATLKDFKEYQYCYVIFIKSTVYVYCSTFSTVIRTF